MDKCNEQQTTILERRWLIAWQTPGCWGSSQWFESIGKNRKNRQGCLCNTMQKHSNNENTSGYLKAIFKKISFKRTEALFIFVDIIFRKNTRDHAFRHSQKNIKMSIFCPYSLGNIYLIPDCVVQPAACYAIRTVHLLPTNIYVFMWQSQTFLTIFINCRKKTKLL